MNNRIKIPEQIKIKIWTEAAGRCQFQNCNKLLWYNDLTLNDTKFGEFAHIIGASKDGPRGRWDSDVLQDKPQNLMLLCERCHKEIDYGKNIKDYPKEVLSKMKKDHEKSIRIALENLEKKTTILTFLCPIQDRFPAIDKRAVRSAIHPYIPDAFENDWYHIKIALFDRKLNTHFEKVVDEINSVFEQLKKRHNNKEIENLSVFAFGPMPLIMYLGKCLGDTIPSSIYQPNRDTTDSEKLWKWQKKGKSTLKLNVQNLKFEKNKNVGLVLSLSDKVSEDKYRDSISNDYSLYEISVDKPHTRIIERKSDLMSFGLVFRSLLNKIQENHGKDCIIHVFPAIPISIAFQCGKELLPTKDPKIYVYEYLNDLKTYVKAIQLL